MTVPIEDLKVGDVVLARLEETLQHLDGTYIVTAINNVSRSVSVVSIHTDGEDNHIWYIHMNSGGYVSKILLNLRTVHALVDKQNK